MLLALLATRDLVRALVCPKIFSCAWDKDIGQKSQQFQVGFFFFAGPSWTVVAKRLSLRDVWVCPIVSVSLFQFAKGMRFESARWRCEVLMACSIDQVKTMPAMIAERHSMILRGLGLICRNESADSLGYAAGKNTPETTATPSL